MAVGTYTVYSNTLLNVATAKINLSTDTFVMVLLTSSYTPAADTHSTWSQVSANETSGAGYNAGGVVLTGVACTLSGALVTFTTASGTWNAASFTAKYAAIVKRAAGALAGTDLLIGYVDLNTSGSVTGQGGAFVVSPSVNGWFQLSHTP